MEAAPRPDDEGIGSASTSKRRKMSQKQEISKWKTRKPSEGFYVTSDLNQQELEDLLQSGNWDTYLGEENIKNMETASFADCELEKIPMSLCQIISISRLYLTNNKLTTLPSEFQQLENLTNLNLAWNKFSRIPDTLFLMPHLEILSLQHNLLTNKGLDKIKKLSQLQELYLTSNDLKGEFPVSICKLTSLRLLDATNNRITTLPKQISSLAELRVLKLRQNDIRRLPASIGELHKLKIACFAENCIESVNFDSFLKLTDLTDLCLFSNRIDNREELEKYIELVRSHGKVLRATENRVDISQKITCDSPYGFCRQDVTFVHDDSDEVKDWVKEAKVHLEKEGISSAIKTPLDKGVDIQRDVGSCHVVIPVFTNRFQDLLKETEEAGGNLRDALNEVVKAKRVRNYLIILREDCFYSSSWSNATFIDIKSGREDDQHVFVELCDKIRKMTGERVNRSSAPTLHF